MNIRKLFTAVLIIVLAAFLLLLTACRDFDFLFKKPDPPEIQYGEFPYKITYKLNGEVYTVEGVYICEYKGVSWNEGTGYTHEWDSHIEGTEDNVLYIAEQDGVKLRLLVGATWYYMGLMNNTKPYEPFFDCEYQYADFTFSTVRDEYLDKFDAEILEWEIPEPLVVNDEE